MPVASQRNLEIGRPRARSSLAAISETTRPAPSLAASRRKGASVMPDMGARRTRLARPIPPIFNDLTSELSEPGTSIRLSDRRFLAAVTVYFEHISCAVKFHAYTLDNSLDLASAVQQKRPFPTACGESGDQWPSCLGTPRDKACAQPSSSSGI